MILVKFTNFVFIIEEEEKRPCSLQTEVEPKEQVMITGKKERRQYVFCTCPVQAKRKEKQDMYIYYNVLVLFSFSFFLAGIIEMMFTEFFLSYRKCMKQGF